MILTVKDLVKRYKEKNALDHFNFEVEQGEVLGLLGPNGCGKTTAINCILSILKFDAGEITIFGESMTQTAIDIKKRIGLVPQEVSLFYDFTVQENIDYFCGLYVTDSAKRKTLVNEAIEFVGLQNYKKYRAKKLSGGLLRRLNIACGIFLWTNPLLPLTHKAATLFFRGLKRSHKAEAQLCTRRITSKKWKNYATAL